MERRIEDYLHLYLGCNVMIERVDYGPHNTTIKPITRGPFKLVEIDISNNSRQFKTEGFILNENDIVKPVLRPLNDMTEDEAIEFGWMRLFTLEHFVEKKLFKSELLAHMLARHFDVFDLITDGLALDSTKMKNLVMDEPEITLPPTDPFPVAGGTPGL